MAVQKIFWQRAGGGELFRNVSSNTFPGDLSNVQKMFSPRRVVLKNCVTSSVSRTGRICGGVQKWPDEARQMMGHVGIRC